MNLKKISKLIAITTLITSAHLTFTTSEINLESFNTTISEYKINSFHDNAATYVPGIASRHDNAAT